MRVNRLRFVGSIAATVLLVLFLSLIQQGFTVFEYAPSEVEKTWIPVGGEVGDEVSRVLWEQRPLDLIVLACLLFITGVGCSSILQAEGDEAR